MLSIVLRVLAVSLLAVSALHLAMGLRADVLLCIALPDSVIASPGLFSQNRFFGVAHGLYAAVLWLAAGELQRYRPVLCAALWLTLLAGLVPAAAAAVRRAAGAGAAAVGHRTADSAVVA
ncbi:MAG: hypothetical protein DI635_09225 [Pseudoxanthomonas suwonensis]|nr:MAG: hypothetical protein DI635_09225 [Pseudoxanthomonas suwonensis]